MLRWSKVLQIIIAVIEAIFPFIGLDKEEKDSDTTKK